MSMTNAAETALLQLLFNNTNWANVGDATGVRGSVTAGVYYVSLHTADPGEAAASGQSTSEVAYTSYARVSVVRTGAGWTVSGNTVSNAALVQFPQATGGSAVATHFGIGTDASGNGNLLWKGALASSLSISTGIQPQFAASALTVVAD